MFQNHRQILVLILYICAGAGVFRAAVPARAQGKADVTIDVDKPGPAVNPRMYGIFLEEINHGVDGGLYAELVRNRGFEDSRPPEGYKLVNGRWVDPAGFDSGFGEFGYSTDKIPFWELVVDGDARGTVQIETIGGVTPESSYCARLEASELGSGRVALANTGFFGIGVKQGSAYELKLHSRAKTLQDRSRSASRMRQESHAPMKSSLPVSRVIGNSFVAH